MNITDLINPESPPGFAKWYIETTRPLEDDRLAYCRKSYGLVAKTMVKEMQAARRHKREKNIK